VHEVSLWRRSLTLWRFSFIRFIAVGLSNTLVGLSVIYLCWRAFGWSDVASNVTGYAVGLLWGFALHRRWTFRADNRIGRGFVRYVAVCLTAYALNLVIVVLMRHLLGPDSFLPHVLGNAAYSLFVFFACRWFVFGGTAVPPALPRTHGF
jgi:putative flippase GtrA